MIVATTPPMGWNSWDCFGVSVTEAEVRANADFMARHLKVCGWEYVVVDLAWYAPDANRDNYKLPGTRQLVDDSGRLVPCPRKFPSSAGGLGFRPLAEYVHGLGLKLGLHIMRGIPVQAVDSNLPILGSSARARDVAQPLDVSFWYKGMLGIDMTRPGAQAYYDSIFALYAHWGVDLIKADDINSWDGDGQKEPYHTDEVEGVAGAIRGCGRPMVLSLSPGAAQLCNVRHLRAHANMWRISADFWDDWGALERQFARCARWAPYAGPGHWPDPDMLPIGGIGIRGEVGEARSTRFTPDEQVTLLTLWYVSRAPLMFGGHLPESDAVSIAQITNPEALAANQQSTETREVFRTAEEAAWAGTHVPSGDRFLALFNLSAATRQVKAGFQDLGLGGRQHVRDLWARRDLGVAECYFAAEIASHGAGLYRLSPAR